MENIDFSFWQKLKIPVIIQTERAECGLACIAMICHAHGLKASLDQLRIRFPLSRLGTKLSTIVNISTKLGLHARPVRAEVSELVQLRLPCILHWKMNHFVVLASIKSKQFEIYDPASGRKLIGNKEFSDCFTGVLLELWPAENFQSGTSQQQPAIPWWKMAGKVPGFWRSISQALILALILEVISLALPLFTQLVVEGVSFGADYQLLFTLAFSFALLALSATLFGAVRSWAIGSIRIQLGLQATGNIFAHLIRLPAAYFERRQLGDVVSRFNSINVIQQIVSTSVVEAGLDGIMVSLTLLLMFIYSPQLAFIPILSVVAYATLRALTYEKYAQASIGTILANARQQNRLIEGIRLAQTIRIASAQGMYQSRFMNLATDVANSLIRAQKFDVVFMAVSSGLFGMERILLLTFGAILLSEGSLSTGALVALVFYAYQFSSRAKNLVDNALQIYLLRVQGGRLADIVNAKQEDGLVTEYVSNEINGTLSVRDISFRHSEGAPWLLRGVGFRVERGQFIAIMGPSGAGKTTLVKILLGVIDGAGGAVEIDGVNIKNVGKVTYREMLGVVMQDSDVFTGSIAENISMFDTGAPLERVVHVAKIALLDDDIRKMPLGYNTNLGSIDNHLSAGQKQRLLIARALYKSPKILIFDEATCHIDIETEKRIYQNLRELQITLIAVTHRIATLHEVDQVLHLRDGKLETENIRQQVKAIHTT